MPNPIGVNGQEFLHNGTDITHVKLSVHTSVKSDGQDVIIRKGPENWFDFTNLLDCNYCPNTTRYDYIPQAIFYKYIE